MYTVTSNLVCGRIIKAQVHIFNIFHHGGIYRIIHHGIMRYITTMVVYEIYTPQMVNQEVCPGHVTRLTLARAMLFACNLAAPSCRAKSAEVAESLYCTIIMTLVGINDWM